MLRSAPSLPQEILPGDLRLCGRFHGGQLPVSTQEASSTVPKPKSRRWERPGPALVHAAPNDAVPARCVGEFI